MNHLVPAWSATFTGLPQLHCMQPKQNINSIIRSWMVNNIYYFNYFVFIKEDICNFSKKDLRPLEGCLMGKQQIMGWVEPVTFTSEFQNGNRLTVAALSHRFNLSALHKPYSVLSINNFWYLAPSTPLLGLHIVGKDVSHVALVDCLSLLAFGYCTKYNSTYRWILSPLSG